MTVMRNTVMLSIVEMPRVIFSPDSAGMRKTNLKCEMFIFMAAQDEYDELSEELDI